MNNLIDYNVVIKVNKKTLRTKKQKGDKSADKKLFFHLTSNIDALIGDLFPVSSCEVINNLLRCVNQWVGHVIASAAKVVSIHRPEHHATQALLHCVHGLKANELCQFFMTHENASKIVGYYEKKIQIQSKF